MEGGKRIESRRVYDGRVVRLSVDRVLLPNGRETDLEMVRHPGAAAVVPVDEERRVVLVRQYRYATDGWLLEVPAGKLDGNEPPERCAARELEEEIGERAGRLVSMGWVWTTPGFSDERIWLFLATDLEPARQRLGEHEVLTVERLPVDEAVARAERGEIADAKSVCALLRCPRFLSPDPPSTGRLRGSQA